MHSALRSSRFRDLRRPSSAAWLGALLVVAGPAIAPQSAVATTAYQLNLGPYYEAASDPVVHDTTFIESNPGVLESTIRCAGLATVRRASPFSGIVTTSTAVNNGGSSTWNSYAQAASDDFLITGPAGPTSVTGTLYYRVAANLSQQGGFPGPASFFIQESHFYFSVLISGGVIQAMGGYTESNNSSFTGGYGELAAVTQPSFDLVLPLTGSFPVGTPFSIQLGATAGGGTALDVTNSPASIEADGGALRPWANRLGIFLGDESGHVMDLPAGYSVSSPDWGVTGGTVAVDDEPVPSAMRVLAAPNPFAAATRVSFVVPAAGHHRLAVVDLSGRIVRTLHSGWIPPGAHEASWDGLDATSRPAPTGVYFVTLSGPRGSVARRLARIR